MSNKKKKVTPVKEVTSYSLFFDLQVRLGKVKSYQFNEIKVFFNELGLSEKETEDKFNEALKKY